MSTTPKFAPRFTPAFDSSIPQPIATHFRQLYLGQGDHDDAIVTLHSMVQTMSVGSSGATTIINQNPAGTSPSGGSSSITSSIGAVNNKTGQTAYSLQSIDNGAQIRLGDASAVAVTLNSSLTTPYFTTLSNEGPSLVTATPSTGLVNGLASIAIPAGSWVTIYFDGVNWEADSPGASSGGVNQLIAGTNISLSPAEGTGAVTITASGTLSLIRTPHVVTGSRSFGSTFQNTTGGEMWVSGYGLTGGGSTGDLVCSIGPVTANQPVYGNEVTATVAGGKAGFNMLVPDTYFYAISVTGDITSPAEWVEFY